jgi:hypothetical protein
MKNEKTADELTDISAKGISKPILVLVMHGSGVARSRWVQRRDDQSEKKCERQKQDDGEA